MIWLYVIVTAAFVFAVAAVTVGSATAGLATRARRSVYDLDEAVAHVASHLDDAVTARLSYDDVRQVLLWHLEYMRLEGIASYRTADDPGAELILVGDTEPLAFVIGRVADAEPESPGAGLSDAEVSAVLDAESGYYRRIGAVGAPVDGPDIG